MVTLLTPQQLVDVGGEFRSELKVVVRDDGSQASSQGDVQVDEDVCGTSGCEFGSGDSEHVGAAAEMVSEKQDVETPAACKGRRSKEINANHHARSIR